ncbi:unnamed protein product, partial [Allacma fusca]
NFSDRFGKSDVVIANSREFFVAVGPIVQKRSYLKDVFERVIEKAVDSGLVDRWIKEDYKNVHMSTTSVKKQHGHEVEVIHIDENNLSLKNLKGAFAALLAGCFTSLSVFVGEVIKYCSKKIVILFMLLGFEKTSLCQ